MNEQRMHSLVSTMAVTFALVSMTGLASAADQNRTETKEKAVKTVGKASEQEAEYLAAVGKCEGMQPKEKQSCIESAKERFGEMLR